MKAIVYRRYGSPDVLACEEISKPAPGDKDVLIAVRAASINPRDWHAMEGTPYFARLMFGLRKPKDFWLGVDVAGQIEAVGRDVTQFKPGDAVFGTCRGSLAEYACAPGSAVVMMPHNATFEQAASVPVAALTALQGLRDKGRLEQGQKVLVNGAAGGCGTFAVQIAKALGAEVVGVCSTRNVDLVRSIGAAHVVDYTQEDFTQGSARYDVIFDCVGNRSLSACRRVLNRQGHYVAIAGPTGRWVAPLPRFLAMLIQSRFVSQQLVVCLTKLSQSDLAILRGFIETGAMTPVIDRRYGLAETADAVRYLEAGHARGKVVITMGDHPTLLSGPSPARRVPDLPRVAVR